VQHGLYVSSTCLSERMRPELPLSLNRIRAWHRRSRRMLLHGVDQFMQCGAKHPELSSHRRVIAGIVVAILGGISAASSHA